MKCGVFHERCHLKITQDLCVCAVEPRGSKKEKRKKNKTNVSAAEHHRRLEDNKVKKKASI